MAALLYGAKYWFFVSAVIKLLLSEPFFKNKQGYTKVYVLYIVKGLLL